MFKNLNSLLSQSHENNFPVNQGKRTSVSLIKVLACLEGYSGSLEKHKGVAATTPQAH